MDKRAYLIVAAATAAIVSSTAAAAVRHVRSPHVSHADQTGGTPTSPAPTPPAPSPTPPHPAPRIPAPIATQDGPRLSIILRTADARPLRPADRRCATLSRPGAVDRRVCVTGGPHPGVRVAVGSWSAAAPDASVERLGPRAVRVTLDSGPLRLRGGTSYRLRGSLTRAGRAPVDSDVVTFRWRTWRITGCRATGPTRITHGPRTDRRVGLSFDDGPSGYTRQVLDLLRENGVHATFFVIGDRLPSGDAMLRRTLAEGNMIGDHSLHHEMPAVLSGIAETQRRIRAATGFTPCSFRPPGGVYNAAMGSGVVGLGMRTITWSIDTRDWTRPGSDHIVRAALRARPGDIILMHDGGGPRGQTIDATRTILRGLRERGLTPVPVEELLGEAPLYQYGS